MSCLWILVGGKWTLLVSQGSVFNTWHVRVECVNNIGQVLLEMSFTWYLSVSHHLMRACYAQ